MAKNVGASSRKTPPIFLIIIGSGLIIIAIAVILLVVKDDNPGVRSIGDGPVPKVVSYQAPKLDLVDLSGNPASLDLVDGQVLLINNWATWCPPCRAEMPILETYYRAHKDEGFILIGINAGDKQDQVEEFACKDGYYRYTYGAYRNFTEAREALKVRKTLTPLLPSG